MEVEEKAGEMEEKAEEVEEKAGKGAKAEEEAKVVECAGRGSPPR